MRLLFIKIGERGISTYDDQKLFELLILEPFQAGLSREIVLMKRD